MNVEEEVSDDKTSQCKESQILNDFKIYAAELTERHDRHERLVRISRDITIESKRIIFYLHSLKAENCKSGLPSAEKRIKALIDGPLKKAAAELSYSKSASVPAPRVLTPAIEELSEAFCLLQYLKTSSTTEMSSWNDLQTLISSKSGEKTEAVPMLILNPLAFMLGVLDYTGELMRVCINNSSTESSKVCYTIRTIMQNLYLNFIGISYNKEVNKKMSVFKQSLQKVEDNCYNLTLRENNN